MLIEQAQTFSPDQINAVAAIVVGLVLSNFGQLIGWGLRSFRKKIKEEDDLRAAHNKIRSLTTRVEKLEKN